MRIPLNHGRRQPVALSAVVTCALAILPTTATAGENDLYVALQFQVDSSTRGCWNEARFRRGVVQRIGYDPFRGDAPLHVRIRVAGNALAVDGKVEWLDANGADLGERAFVAKDGNCGKLMTEMSFAVGLQIEFLRMKPSKPAANADGPAPPAALDPNAVSPSSNDDPLATPPVPEAPPPVSEPASPPPTPATAAAKPDSVESPPPEPPPEEPVSSPPSEPSPR